jgi:hypothetical protein
VGDTVGVPGVVVMDGVGVGHQVDVNVGVGHGGCVGG